MGIINKIIKENNLVLKSKEQINKIKENKEMIKKDGKGNIINYKDSDGFEYWKEYDNNDNVINKLELVSGRYYLNNKLMIKKDSDY